MAMKTTCWAQQTPMERPGSLSFQCIGKGKRVVLYMNGALADSVGEPHENALPGRRRVAVRPLPCDGDRRVPGRGNSGPQCDVAGLVECTDGDEDAGGIFQPRLVEPAVVQARQSRGVQRDTPAGSRLSHRRLAGGT